MTYTPNHTYLDVRLRHVVAMMSPVGRGRDQWACLYWAILGHWACAVIGARARALAKSHPAIEAAGQDCSPSVALSCHRP